eukprot:scaffold74530_cov19-Tisochrysis_lutea.AAC.2
MGTWPPVPGCTPTCSKRSLASAIASPGAGSVSMGAWLPPTDWAAACAWGVECSVAQGAAAGLASIGDRPTSLRGVCAGMRIWGSGRVHLLVSQVALARVKLGLGLAGSLL